MIGIRILCNYDNRIYDPVALFGSDEKGVARAQAPNTYAYAHPNESGGSERAVARGDAAIMEIINQLSRNIKDMKMSRARGG